MTHRHGAGPVKPLGWRATCRRWVTARNDRGPALETMDLYGPVALAVRRELMVAIASSGILDRTADEGGLAASIADWLHLDSRPSGPAPRPEVATPVASAWRQFTPLGRLTLVVNRAAGGARPADVLAAWRAAERDLAATPVGEPEWTVRAATVSDLRTSYHRLFEERRDRSEGLDPR